MSRDKVGGKGEEYKRECYKFVKHVFNLIFSPDLFCCLLTLSDILFCILLHHLHFVISLPLVHAQRVIGLIRQCQKALKLLLILVVVSISFLAQSRENREFFFVFVSRKNMRIEKIEVMKRMR